MSADPDTARRLALLERGSLSIVGRVAGSSNATFAVVVTHGEDEWFAIYKPMYGERPLWDFEPGLHRRERAAYLLSEELGWGLVPPTVIREDAPAGVGSLQWFIEAREAEHYFTMVGSDASTHAALRRLAVFDAVANNTDRKSGHVLRDADGRIWAIDHGLCFAEEDKLRTVIWDFAGEPVPDDVLADLAPLAETVPASLAEVLTGSERRALRNRARRILADPVMPVDLTGGYAYPWPLV